MVEVKSIGQLLRDNPFFEGMDDDTLEFVAGCAANETYHAGDFIFREGGNAERFYIIRHGGVALEFHVPSQEPIIIQTRRDGDIMGWSWLAPPFRWGWDARVVQLTRVVSFDAKCLRAKMDENPALGYDMCQRFLPVIHDRLSAARLQMVDMYTHPREKAK